MLIFQIANKHLSKAVYCKGGGDSGAKEQARATEKGIELQREMWQTNMQNLAPFTPLAQQYVSQLQNLSSLQGQGQALNQYYNSQQYKDLAGQARYQSLAAAEATGGLGSTATGNQLAAIAPTLGQNWLSGQMNNYNNLANIGLGALPASSIAAPATSSASAQNYAMKKDIDAIANADASALDFMTGMTGGAGNPAIGADVRSRLTGKEQRQLYNSAQRIQGRMQNQGVAAARDMGASGINTVAEAKMYFQGMPQVDYSSPEAMQQSIREIQEYTNNYNQQYNVNVGKSQRQQSQPAQVSQPAASSNFSSLWGD